MITLLQQYSLSEILTFIVILALAVKSTVSFFDWAQERVQKAFNLKSSKLNEKEQIEKRFQHGSQIMKSLKQQQYEFNSFLKELEAKINILMDSDKDDIRAYITRQHHYFCYQKGWIDDFSLDCVEKRFQHYKEEGGNSFIENFMNELRALPKQPPDM